MLNASAARGLPWPYRRPSDYAMNALPGLICRSLDSLPQAPRRVRIGAGSRLGERLRRWHRPCTGGPGQPTRAAGLAWLLSLRLSTDPAAPAAPPCPARRRAMIGPPIGVDYGLRAGRLRDAPSSNRQADPSNHSASGSGTAGGAPPRTPVLYDTE